MKKIGLFAYGEMGQPVLSSLIKDFSVQWIILPSPQKQTKTEKLTEKVAKKNKIPVTYISSFKDMYHFIKNQTPDLVVVSSFNKVFTKDILGLTRFVNIHLGDLPKYRGRATVNWAIINDRKEIGVIFHEVIPELDSGNIYEKYMIAISDKDTVGTIYEEINKYLLNNSSRVILKIVKGYKGKSQKGTATYCCTRLPEDGLIDWHKTSREIFNFIRALAKPYPGAFTYFEEKRMIIWSAEIPKEPIVYEGRISGRICSILPNYGVEVLTGDGSIIIKKVTYKGKNYNASEIIKSIKKTLGINWVELYEKIHED